MVVSGAMQVLNQVEFDVDGTKELKLLYVIRRGQDGRMPHACNSERCKMMQDLTTLHEHSTKSSQE